MKEIWKDIQGYEGIYKISTYGNVRSLGKYKNGNGGSQYYSTGRILKKYKTGNYLYVILYKNLKPHTTRIHHLVWENFGEVARNGRVLQVDHIDDNPTNNNIENLQLLTPRDNIVKYHKKQKYSSKYTGVSWHKVRKKWQANIYISPKKKYLGLFESEMDAHLAYQKALMAL